MCDAHKPKIFDFPPSPQEDNFFLFPWILQWNEDERFHNMSWKMEENLLFWKLY